MKNVCLMVLSALLLSVMLCSCDETEPLPDGVSAESDVPPESLIESETGEIRWPSELLPEGFPVANYTEIYSAERKDNEVTIILFGENSPPNSFDSNDFIQKLYDSGFVAYDDVKTGERFIVSRDGCRVSVAKSDEWTGEHLKSINAKSPTGFTFEIKVARIDAPAECLFWQYPDAGADLGLEQAVFTEWPTEYLPEGFEKPDADIEILEMKQEKNGLFITLKGEMRKVGAYQTRIISSLGYISTVDSPIRNPNGDYMYVEQLDFQGSGSAYTVTVRLQLCPANDKTVKQP